MFLRAGPFQADKLPYEQTHKAAMKPKNEKVFSIILHSELYSYEGGRSLLAKHCWDQLGHNFV
jgi:hypothetical protein